MPSLPTETKSTSCAAPQIPAAPSTWTLLPEAPLCLRICRECFLSQGDALLHAHDSPITAAQVFKEAGAPRLLAAASCTHLSWGTNVQDPHMGSANTAFLCCP